MVRGYLQGLLYSSLLALSACSQPPSSSHLSIEERTRLESIIQKSEALFTPRGQELIRKGKWYVAELEPSEAIKNEIPAGQFWSENDGMYLDCRYFAARTDDELVSVAAHEAGHLLDIRFRFIGSREHFQKLYDGMDAEKYPIKTRIEDRLKAYDPDKSKPTLERIAFMTQYMATAQYDLPKPLHDLFAPYIVRIAVPTTTTVQNPTTILHPPMAVLTPSD